jgi:hypothetical protein
MYVCCKDPDVMEVNEEKTILPNFEIGIRKNLKCRSCGANHELTMMAERKPLRQRGEVKEF